MGSLYAGLDFGNEENKPAEESAAAHPTAEEQERMLQEVAKQHGESSPARIAEMEHGGRTMRGLVATEDLPAGATVSTYPVQLVSDDEKFDRKYAVVAYTQEDGEPDSARKKVLRISGIPTPKSLAHRTEDEKVKGTPA